LKYQQNDINRVRKFHKNLFGCRFEDFHSEDKTFQYDSITIDGEDGNGLLNGKILKKQDSSKIQ
jgi:predicted enzyme related to lactoylglutathione lyase